MKKIILDEPDRRFLARIRNKLNDDIMILTEYSNHIAFLIRLIDKLSNNKYKNDDIDFGLNN